MQPNFNGDCIYIIIYIIIYMYHYIYNYIYILHTSIYSPLNRTIWITEISKRIEMPTIDWEISGLQPARVQCPAQRTLGIACATRRVFYGVAAGSWMVGVRPQICLDDVFPIWGFLKWGIPKSPWVTKMV